MSQSSGKMLEQAYSYRAKAGIWMNWMLEKRRIPIEVLDYVIAQMECSLIIMKQIKARGRGD